MAEISPNVSSQAYTANGIVTAFTFPFSVVSETDVLVLWNGAPHGTGYSVTFGDLAGTVTFQTPPPNGTEIRILLDPDYVQTSEFADQSSYNLSTVNTINRRAAIRDLVNKDKGDRALKVPLGETGPEIPLSDIPSLVAVGDSLLGGDDIATVAGAIANVGTVAGSIANVNIVAGIYAAVSTVAGISAAVSTVAGISASVTTVAGISANVTTVAGVAGGIATLAPIAANITTLAGIAGNVTTVAGVASNVTTVATNIAGVNSAATNMAAIIAAPAQAAAAAASAVEAGLQANRSKDHLRALPQNIRTSGATKNADGTCSFTTFAVWSVGDITTSPELLAARSAVKPIKWLAEWLSGAALTSVYMRQYLAINLSGGQIGANIQLTDTGDDFAMSRVLDPACMSLDIVMNCAGTATVKNPSFAVVEGVRPVTDPAFLAAQGRAITVKNRALPIPFQLDPINVTGGTIVRDDIAGTITISPSSSGYQRFFFLQRIADGQPVSFSCATSAPGAYPISSGSMRYDQSGNSAAPAGFPGGWLSDIGNGSGGAIVKASNVVSIASPTLGLYGYQIDFNNTSANTIVLSDFSFWNSVDIPPTTEVAAVVEKRISSAVMTESDSGSLVRRFWILADSVFHQTDLTGPTPVTTAKIFLGDFGRLGDRARIKNLAVPGSGLRAMMSHAGLPPTIVTITGNEMPASGSVAVTAWTGDPITAFFGTNPEFSRIFYLRGVKVRVRATSFHSNLWPNSGALFLDRLEAGPVMPVPAGSRLISEQALMMRDDFVAIEGSINPSNPSMTVLQGAAAFFAARDAIAPATKSLFMPALMSVPGVTPVIQNAGHSNTAALVASYGVDRILDLNASGIPGGNYLSADEATFMASIGWTATGTDNAYMALGHRPPSMAPDTYHPDDYCDQLLGRRFAFCNAVQNYMETIV